MRSTPSATVEPRSRSGALTGYVGAALLSGLAVSLRWALTPIFHDQPSFLLFMPAVILSAAFWGPGPALLATGLTFVGGVALNDIAVLSHPADQVNALLFMVMGPAIAYGGWRLRRQTDRKSTR